MPAPRLRYFAWLRTLPAASARRHDLVGSGMAAEDAAVLAARAGTVDPAYFEDLAFAPRDRIERPLADLLRLPRAQLRVMSAATGALYVTLRALLGPGTRVAVEEPGYEPLWAMAECLGAEVQFFQRRLEDGRLLGKLPPAAVYLVSHTHNPTGFPLHPDDLAALRAGARAQDGKLVIAGAYALYLADDGLPRPLPPEVVLTGSLTKVLGLSPLRLGYAAFGDPALSGPLQDAYDLLEIYPPSAAAELALRVAFDGLLLARARAHAAALAAPWRHLAAELPAGFRLVPPPCGVHALLHLPAGTDDLRFAADLSLRHEVWVVPGSLFRAPGTIRIGCGRPLPQVEAALEILGDGVWNLHAGR